MKQYGLTLSLREDAELIAEYERYHRAVWPEVLESLRASGIRAMRIWRSGTLLLMVIETEDDFSFERKASMDRANPRVLEWEALMGRFQSVEEGQDSTRRWQVMDEVFCFAAGA